MTNVMFVHSEDKLAKMQTKFHVIQVKLIMSVWCFTVHCARLVIVVPSNSTQQQCPLCIVQWEQSEIILLVSSAGRVASVPTSGGWVAAGGRTTPNSLTAPSLLGPGE